MKLDHINIKAPKELLEREKSFFCEVLGLKEGARPNMSQQGYWLYSGETALVHLSESDHHYQNEKPGYFDHVAFRASNLASLLNTLKAKDIEYSSVTNPETNLTQIFFRTPTNTRIEVSFEN